MRLSITPKQQELLVQVFENYDWLCDCPDFPDCNDFKSFQKLKKRIKELPDRIRTNFLKKLKDSNEFSIKLKLQGDKG